MRIANENCQWLDENAEILKSRHGSGYYLVHEKRLIAFSKDENSIDAHAKSLSDGTYIIGNM